jgi:Tfp pilus assembly protein PilN
MQQQALRSITQMEQTKQTLKQVEQLYKDRLNPPKLNKPAKKPNG